MIGPCREVFGSRVKVKARRSGPRGKTQTEGAIAHIRIRGVGKASGDRPGGAVVVLADCEGEDYDAGESDEVGGDRVSDPGVRRQYGRGVTEDEADEGN